MTFLENHPAQAAVILQARDGGIYRIAADFLKGILNLSKLDPSGKGTLIEKEKEKIRLWIRKELNGLEETEISSLFMIDRSRLPSAVSFQNGGFSPLSGSAGSSAAPRPTRTSGLSPEEKMEKEKRLKEAQKKLEEISQYEQESLTIRDKASAIKRRIEESEALDLRLNQLHETEEKKYLPLAGIEKIPPDLLKRYEEGLQNKQNELAQLEEETTEVDNQFIGIGAVDPLKNRPLQIGVGVVVFSFVLPLIFTLHGPFRYLFLMGIFSGIGLAAKAYLHLSRQSATKEGLQKKRVGLNEKTHQIEKKFEKEHKEIIELIKKTGAKEIQEFKGLQRTYQNHFRNVQEAVAKKQALLKEETIENLEAQRLELEKKAETLEDKLRDNEGLTQEVYRLQDEARDSSNTLESSVDLESSLPAFSLTSEELSASTEKLFPLPFLPRALTIGKQHGMPLQMEEIRKQADILSSLFSPENKREIHLNELGEIKLGEAGIERLSSGMADQIFLCVALSTWDRFSEIPFPLVLDDPWINLDPKHQGIALELLRGASKKRQVLLFTFSPSPSTNGDHRVQL